SREHHNPHQPQEAEGYPGIRGEDSETKPWHPVHRGGRGEGRDRAEVRPWRTPKKGRCKATIEIEAEAAAAASLHGDSTAIKFVLVGVSQRTTYSYNTQAGL
ncbi:unnamed protein product, partial [Ectocarpus sp. 13 AM-2016]